MQRAVDASVRQHHARHAADREQEDEAQRPDHRQPELDRPAPHRCNPREDLHARRHRDHHRGENEVGLRVHLHAGRIHVVRPHDEPDEADRDHGVGHAEIAEHAARQDRHDMADDAEARQDENVHFRVAEEPEQMLVQQRVAAAGRLKKVVPKLRSVSSIVIAPASTGSDRSSRNAVISTAHTNSGILCSVMPGARMLKIVVMKLIAPRIDEAPAMCSDRIAKSIAGPGCPDTDSGA